MKLSSMLFGFALLNGAFAEAQQYVISTYAGGPPPPGANMTVSVGSVVTDAAGNLYFSAFSTSCACVFKLDPSGNVTRVAGGPKAGFSGDGGPAIQAQIYRPVSLAVDSAGGRRSARTFITAGKASCSSRKVASVSASGRCPRTESSPQ